MTEHESNTAEVESVASEPEFDPTLTPAEEKLASTRWTNEGPVEEPETEKEPESKPEPKAEPQDEFDNDVLAKANHYGISPEEAREFGSKKALDRAISLIERQWAAMQQQTQPPAQQPLPTQPGETQKEAAKRLGLDPEGFHPELVDWSSATAKELAELKAWKQSFEQREQQFVQQQAQQAWDKLFDDLDNEVKKNDPELFGKGSMFDQPNGSSTRANREKIATAVLMLREGYARNGLPVPELGELVQRAKRLEFGDVLERRITQKQNQQITAHAKRRIGVPQRSRDDKGQFADKDPKNDPDLKEMYDSMVAGTYEKKK